MLYQVTSSFALRTAPFGRESRILRPAFLCVLCPERHSISWRIPRSCLDAGWDARICAFSWWDRCASDLSECLEPGLPPQKWLDSRDPCCWLRRFCRQIRLKYSRETLQALIYAFCKPIGLWASGQSGSSAVQSRLSSSFHCRIAQVRPWSTPLTSRDQVAMRNLLGLCDGKRQRGWAEGALCQNRQASYSPCFALLGWLATSQGSSLEKLPSASHQQALWWPIVLQLLLHHKADPVHMQGETALVASPGTCWRWSHASLHLSSYLTWRPPPCLPRRRAQKWCLSFSIANRDLWEHPDNPSLLGSPLRSPISRLQSRSLRHQTQGGHLWPLQRLLQMSLLPFSDSSSCVLFTDIRNSMNNLKYFECYILNLIDLINLFLF